MEDYYLIRDRLQARLDQQNETIGVPDAWLPHLAELDAAIAAIDPHYKLAQVKEKFGGLRFYVRHAGTTPEDVERIRELVAEAEQNSYRWA
jgi:hypothetical protein